MRLAGKVAIITGSARGIGAAFAKGFAKEGAKVVVADVRDGAATVGAITGAGGEAVYVKTDVTVQAECDAAAKVAAERFGGIDILVNDAGVLVTIKHFMEVTSEEWMEVMKINTLGPFQCIKAVFPYMRDKGGKVINISSGTVFEGAPGLPQYIASKGAVMAMTRGMARDLGEYRINVNAIAPGFTHSEGGDEFDRNKKFPDVPLDEVQLPGRCFKEPVYPDDLVGTAVYLASDDSRMVTGQLILHDGGMTMH
ncbi:MAG: SDR family oxidoreductase [Acidobacteriota bacterium]|jgi:NAD(P)-dependent dehydrogenase (short-subunit alcohol dehydrogenase family)|nr:SDR family oxidoreductase [Acidobacteriota bacterium]